MAKNGSKILSKWRKDKILRYVTKAVKYCFGSGYRIEQCYKYGGNNGRVAHIPATPLNVVTSHSIPATRDSRTTDRTLLARDGDWRSIASTKLFFQLVGPKVFLFNRQSVLLPPSTLQMTVIPLFP